MTDSPAEASRQADFKPVAAVGAVTSQVLPFISLSG
jgi:hypothetical protein